MKITPVKEVLSGSLSGSVIKENPGRGTHFFLFSWLKKKQSKTNIQKNPQTNMQSLALGVCVGGLVRKCVCCALISLTFKVLIFFLKRKTFVCGKKKKKPPLTSTKDYKMTSRCLSRSSAPSQKPQILAPSQTYPPPPKTRNEVTLSFCSPSCLFPPSPAPKRSLRGSPTPTYPFCALVACQVHAKVSASPQPRQFSRLT